MSDKTKAAMQGRPSHHIKSNQAQLTRVSVGGQRLSDAKIIAPNQWLITQVSFITLGIVSVSFSEALKSALGFSSNRDQRAGPCVDGQNFNRLNFKPADLIQFFSQRNFAPADLIQLFGSSLAFLRWRRLISPLAAVTRKPAVLSPLFFKSSISSITSWGIRTVVICDFAFFAPVAITETPCGRCISVYAKKMIIKDLRCISLWASFRTFGDIHQSSARPGSVGALTGPLTTRLLEITLWLNYSIPKLAWNLHGAFWHSSVRIPNLYLSAFLLRPQPNTKPVAFLLPTLSFRWLHACQLRRFAMLKISNESLTAIACELAALLVVVEECEIEHVTRENLIGLARRVSDGLAASMVEQNSTGVLNG